MTCHLKHTVQSILRLVAVYKLLMDFGRSRLPQNAIAAVWGGRYTPSGKHKIKIDGHGIYTHNFIDGGVICENKAGVWFEKGSVEAAKTYLKYIKIEKNNDNKSRSKR